MICLIGKMKNVGKLM